MQITISSLFLIAKLDKTDQSKITDLSKVQPKDIKKKAVATSNNDKKEVVTSNKEGSEKSDNASFSNEFTDVDTNSNDETAVATSDNFSESDEDITKWESAIKGYALLAAERAGFTTEQTNALLGGMIKVLSVFDKSDAEKKYNNR